MNLREAKYSLSCEYTIRDIQRRNIAWATNVLRVELNDELAPLADMAAALFNKD